MNPTDLASKSTAGASPGPRETWMVFLRENIWWMLSLFLTGLGAKLWLIHRSGTPLPYWDQWDGEAKYLFVPYFEGHLSLAMLFRGHNEHRIFFTRIYDLALLLLNGQWDNQLEMVGNAAFHSAILAGFGGLLARFIGKAIWPFVWPPLALALILPFAWENTLCGLQSCFYFMLFFTLLAIWFLGLSRPLSARWWWGVVFAIAALFTLASGFLASAAVAALALLDLLKRRRSWRQSRPTLAVCGIITVAGLFLKPDVPVHHVLMAHSAGEFLTALGNNLAWPWIVLPVYAPCNLFPLILLGWHYLRTKEPAVTGERLVLGLGFWVGLQAAAAAYGRGAGGGMPYWRYMDSTSFTMIANCAAIGLLLLRYRRKLWPARLWAAGFVLWGIACLTGLALLTNRAWQIDIPEHEFYQRMQLKTTRAFIATDDAEALRHLPPLYLATDDPRTEATHLRNPHIRRILPACVREPLKVEMAAQTGDAFIPRGWNLQKPDPPTESSWGSFNAQGAAATGTFESQPIRASRFPFLEIELAGDIGEPGLSFELVELATGKRTAIRPAAPPGVRWQRYQVKAPAGEFKIIARDESRTGWFAFKAPAELGWLSWLAAKATGCGPVLFVAGLLLYGFSVLLAVLLRFARDH